jgi:hypothetical protein
VARQEGDRKVTKGIRRLPVLAVTVAAALVGSFATAGAASAQTTTTVVASGLDNPRDLAFTPGGKLYLAEAGHGGSECIPGGEQGTLCVGFTSSIAQITPGGVHTVVSGLVSTASPDGTSASGIDGISAVGDTIYGIITESSDIAPDGPNPFLSPQTVAKARAELGRLITVNPAAGTWSAFADVGHFDFGWTAEHASLVPDQFPDANPYGVYATKGIKWVVDAAANTLDEVFPNGVVKVVAFFPNPPVSDAVPTCVDRGPDGALYVGELTGGGNAPGASVVWRVVPGHAPEAWATGLTAVTGCGFGADGRFYAVEFSTLGLDNAAPGTGAVVVVPAHSTSPAVLVGELSFPGGFAASKDGSLYVSNWSIMPAENHGGPTGQVLRIRP